MGMVVPTTTWVELRVFQWGGLWLNEEELA